MSAEAEFTTQHVDRSDLARQIEHAAAETDIGACERETGVDAWINRVAEVLGAAVLIAITGIVFANATFRYVLNSGIIWGDEIVIALVPWLAMLGMFLSVRRREVIRIEHFVARLPFRARKAAKTCADLISAVALVYLAYVSFEYLSIFGTDKTVYLRLPTYWFQSALAVGAVMLTAAFVADAVRAARGGRDEDER